MRYCASCHSVYPNDFRICPKDHSELIAASELQPGMVLRGKYEILGKLGSGGMATVYRARHLAFGEVRAIKLVGRRLEDDEDFLRRFRNEAIVARRLQHPNAVRVEDLDTTEDGRPFIVMEYVEGHNLREVIRRDGALPARRAVRVARQVASALAAAHELGIIHRDIKPDNIILAGSGESETAKVLDFGIAKIKEGAAGDSGAVATRTGMVVGTPQYISPEQAMGRRSSELDGRADLYSLAVVLFEMVTGRLPFESDTAMGLILHHLQTAPPRAHDLRPDLGIPEPLTAVLLRAMEKDPDRRYRSATEMAAALDEVLALPLPEAPSAAAGPEPTPGSSTPRPIPADIDRRETRVMPKTPPVTAHGSALPASSTPPPIPTPTPAATSAGARVTPPPLPPIPPPVPPPVPRTIATPATAVFAAGTPPRRKRRWWLWGGLGLLVMIVLASDDDRPARRRPPPSPSPSPTDQVEGEAHAMNDSRVAIELAAHLKANPRTRRYGIEIDVDEGVVTLSGDAPAGVAEEAERIARGIAGVRDVQNGIDVDDEAPPLPDAEASPAPGAHPPLPPRPPGLRGVLTEVTREAVQNLLREGQADLKAGRAGEALGKFGAALGLDPWNEEAKKGMHAAGELMKAQQQRREAQQRELRERLQREREERRRRRESQER